MTHKDAYLWKVTFKTWPRYVHNALKGAQHANQIRSARGVSVGFSSAAIIFVMILVEIDSTLIGICWLAKDAHWTASPAPASGSVSPALLLISDRSLLPQKDVFLSQDTSKALLKSVPSVQQGARIASPWHTARFVCKVIFTWTTFALWLAPLVTMAVTNLVSVSLAPTIVWLAMPMEDASPAANQ